MRACAQMESSGYFPVSPLKLAANFATLKLFSPEEQRKALVTALQEISAQDYSGGRPPEKSYEAGVRGDELFAFAWDSTYFRRRMYFKFCLHKEGEDSFSLYIASLHPENPVKAGTRNRQ
jgi:hypothetical protein